MDACRCLRAMFLVNSSVAQFFDEMSRKNRRKLETNRQVSKALCSHLGRFSSFTIESLTVGLRAEMTPLMINKCDFMCSKIALSLWLRRRFNLRDHNLCMLTFEACNIPGAKNERQLGSKEIYSLAWNVNWSNFSHFVAWMAGMRRKEEKSSWTF